MKPRTRMPLTVAGAILACIVTGVPPAHATFPGRNGLIAFQAQATADAHIEIYTVRQNGHDLRQITHLDADAIRPDWSPDGRQIVFEIDRPDAPFCSVALMNPDGSDIVELTPQTNICEGDPSFTPDGSRIVFHRFDPATTQGDACRDWTGRSADRPRPGNLLPRARELYGRRRRRVPGARGAGGHRGNPPRFDGAPRFPAG